MARLAAKALLLMGALPLHAQQRAATPAPEQADAAFRAGYVAYHQGRFSQAAAQLEPLVAQAPNSFPAHELLGLVYAAEGEDKKAEAQMRVAVQLQPDSVTARDNLATCFARQHMLADAEREWVQVRTQQPQDYSATRSLAKLYLQGGKVNEALPLLTAAHALQPADHDNNYDLALADMLSGHLPVAEQQVKECLRTDNTGDLHNLLGQIDEKQGEYIDAANEFSEAAHLDPSDDNLFAWGSELLLHRAYEAAITVFRSGTERYPQSPRLWVGLGMALYSRGDYEPAVSALLSAADLNASDPRCYLFLSKAYLSSPNQAEAVIQRFKRYAELNPNNALAQFYYGMGLWKGRRLNAAEIDTKAVETLLQRSITLDGRDAEVHLQLGVLYNDEHAWDKAMPEYQRAVALDPDLADAHFRLGRLYLREGDPAKGNAELDRFKQLQAAHQAQNDKERAEVRQFILATNAPASQP